MLTKSWFLGAFLSFQAITFAGSQFLYCHEDATFYPEDGPLEYLQFTWLGLLQYIHIEKGTPHYFRLPRVVLISRLFVLSTAVDAAKIPDGYALGNIIFGEYERDEEECKITVEQISKGVECQPAVMLIPIADVLLHPEYKLFNMKNSVALLKLLKPVRSRYMLPVCLPYSNYLILKSGNQTDEPMVHVDYISDVPRDFMSEDKEISHINLTPRKWCFTNQSQENDVHLGAKRVVCSSGCGFHSGSPSIIHELTGHFTLVAMALGGPSCPDPLRLKSPPPTPQHLQIHTYVPWITTAIRGKQEVRHANDDPFGFSLPRHENSQRQGWIGHWWMQGSRCHDRGSAALDMHRFYHEIFLIKPVKESNLMYILEVSSPEGTSIVCVKIGMPYRMNDPEISDIDSSSIKVKIPITMLPNVYRLQVQAWGTSNVSVTSSRRSSDGDDEADDENVALE